MARKVYGTTLWGGEFLRHIEKATDDGRLSRGKSYANTGKIYGVKVSAKTISAKVKGNYAPFYSTKLTFTPLILSSFFDAKVMKTQDFENKNPAYSLSSYFGVLEIVKSGYECKIYIDKFRENYRFA